MFDCILLMAGKGLRTNLTYNKTLYKINNQPIYMFSLKKFMNIKECANIIIVTSSDDFEQVINEVDSLADGRIKVVVGGTTRQESVQNGFKHTQSDYVLIHDGARPFVKEEEIIKVYLNTKTYQASVLATAVKDTIKIVEEDFITKTLDRKTLYAMQTPQGVNRTLFKKCLDAASKENYLGTDDVELVEKFSDVKVKIVIGSDENIKVTTSRDLQILEFYKGD